LASRISLGNGCYDPPSLRCPGDFYHRIERVRREASPALVVA
jgi:hypothetical protein